MFWSRLRKKKVSCINFIAIVTSCVSLKLLVVIVTSCFSLKLVVLVTSCVSLQILVLVTSCVSLHLLNLNNKWGVPNLSFTKIIHCLKQTCSRTQVFANSFLNFTVYLHCVLTCGRGKCTVIPIRRAYFKSKIFTSLSTSLQNMWQFRETMRS